MCGQPSQRHHETRAGPFFIHDIEASTRGACTRARYEYVLQDGSFDFAPDSIDCPDLEALDLDASQPEPTIPPGVADALRGGLGALDDGSLNEELVLDIAQQVAEGAPIVEVTTVAGVIGVAIGNGIDECVAASVTVGSIDVWHVPKVLARPGEVGCSAHSAARSEGQRHPH